LLLVHPGAIIALLSTYALNCVVPYLVVTSCLSLSTPRSILSTLAWSRLRQTLADCATSIDTGKEDTGRGKGDSSGGLTL